MERGNVSKAIKLLSENTFNGVPPTNKTLEQLQMKHPEEKSVDPEILLNDTLQKVHPIRFEEINEECVKRAALKTKKKILTSKSFGTASSDL